MPAYREDELHDIEEAPDVNAPSPSRSLAPILVPIGLIVLGPYIYGLDLGILVCLDVETGKRQWKSGRYGHGQMLLADDLLVILTEKSIK